MFFLFLFPLFLFFLVLFLPDLCVWFSLESGVWVWSALADCGTHWLYLGDDRVGGHALELTAPSSPLTWRPWSSPRNPRLLSPLPT